MRRFQIPVCDAFAVRGGEPARDRDGDLHRLAKRHRALREALGQRLALEQFRDDEELIVVDADVVEGEDVGMRERRDGTRFALEARASIGILRDVGGSTLMATSRPSRASRARYTSPIPPAPSGATISYGPRRVPADRGMGDADSRRITLRHHKALASGVNII